MHKIQDVYKCLQVYDRKIRYTVIDQAFVSLIMIRMTIGARLKSLSSPQDVDNNYLDLSRVSLLRVKENKHI